jgi:hypothetical protein
MCYATRIWNNAADSSASATATEPTYAVYRPASDATQSQPATSRLPVTSNEEVDLVKSMTRQQRREYVANFLRTEVCFQIDSHPADARYPLALQSADCGLPYYWLSKHM